MLCVAESRPCAVVAMVAVLLATGTVNGYSSDYRLKKFNKGRDNMAESAADNGDKKASEAAPVVEAKEPVTTEHSVKIGKKTLSYEATAGTLPLVNEKTGETEAHIFFTAYTVKPEKGAMRPLTFVFNGGPGSSSIWLHLGAVGPMRVRMEDEGWLPAPPYELVPNPDTWLDHTDLVFVDPVGTGYSRATKEEHNKKFWQLKGDIESVGEFVRLYLSRFNRWGAPVYLAGESYGTTRAAGLAGHLVDRGVGISGVILLSTVLNFLTVRFSRGNDLPYILFVPTYAATAWYHRKLAADLQKKPLREFLDEVEAWVEDEYTVALMKGDRLSERERTRIGRKLARYIGLSPEFVDRSNLRVMIFHFCKELLRDQKRTVGRLDSRFQGIDANHVTERPDFDPSMLAIMPPYTTLMNRYARATLNFESDLTYEVLSYDVFTNWEYERGQVADTSEALRSALAKNPFTRVFVGRGYYDLATPHFAAEYTMNHMDIDPALRDNIVYADYGAGHMFYLDINELAKLKKDVVAFMSASD